MRARIAGKMSLITEPKLSDAPRKSRKKERPAHENLSEESSLPEGEEYLALAARATSDALRDWDVTSGALCWPHGLQRLLGHSPTPETRKLVFWQRNLHPEDGPEVLASIRDALVGRGDHWSGEYRFRRGDGTYLHLLERAYILRNAEGAAVRFVGSLMDVTARKQLQDQLVRSQKMEAFGQLAGGLAHDFNNFLTAILGYSDLLLGEKAVRGAVAKHIGEIRAAANRASNLTSQLLAFSRRHPLHPCVVELNQLITDLEYSLLRLLGENISVQCDLHAFEDGGYIRVDPNQMKQIIINLAVNARDAMPTGGKLIVATDELVVAKKAKTGPEELAPGKYLIVRMTDNGAGMSERVKDHLFEPFFTTKEAGRSSGLGLATSYGIIRQSGGHIAVESKIGRGTTVTLYIPRVPAPAYTVPESKDTLAGEETILVLEDDIAVRHTSVRALRGLGYHVLEAASAEDAQRLITEEGAGQIHLLLTDVIMPKMSGHHFADWMREASPATKVIFISGYLDASMPFNNSGSATSFFLAKPFDSIQLATAVRTALDV